MKIPFTDITISRSQNVQIIPPPKGVLKPVSGDVLKVGPRPFTGQSWHAAHRAVKSARNDMAATDTRVVKADKVRMFAMAQVSRLTADWPVSISSADAEILVSAIAGRSRMRQLERDDDYMRRMLRLFQNNVVGHQGIQLQMKAKDSTGKQNGKPKFSYDSELNAQVQDWWKKQLSRKNCTVSRNMSGVELQRLLVRCKKRDGAVMVRQHRGFNNECRYALEPLEIDFLNFFHCGRAAGTGNLIKFGIEYDSYNAPVAYWILNRHPGEVFSQDGWGKYFETRVPADEIFMLFDVDRANQMLGMPDFCSVATRLNMLHKTIEAVAVATRAGAAKMGFIENENPTELTEKRDDAGNPVEELTPGAVENLFPGQKFVGFDPKQPTDSFQAFIKEELRGISSGAGLDYASVANDRENENYSSLKAGRLESVAQFQADQTALIEQLMEPWFENALPFGIISGQIGVPATKLQKILDGAFWQPRVWQSVEPLKEVQADLLEIEGKLASRREKIAERGRKVEDVDEELEEDEASLKAHGLDEPPPVLPTIKKGAEPGVSNAEMNRKLKVAFDFKDLSNGKV